MEHYSEFFIFAILTLCIAVCAFGWAMGCFSGNGYLNDQFISPTPPGFHPDDDSFVDDDSEGDDSAEDDDSGDDDSASGDDSSDDDSGDDDSGDDDTADDDTASAFCETIIDRIYDDCGFQIQDTLGYRFDKEEATAICDESGSFWLCIQGCSEDHPDNCEDFKNCVNQNCPGGLLVP